MSLTSLQTDAAQEPAYQAPMHQPKTLRALNWEAKCARQTQAVVATHFVPLSTANLSTGRPLNST